MQRLGWVSGALVAFSLLAHCAAARAQVSWWSDPFRTSTDVSPSPGVPWEPRQPLPTITAPDVAPQPTTSAPLTLAELTEYALRNNPRTRQAWFAARAAAAGVGVEQADLLPQITGTYGLTRIRPVSGTTGITSPPQTRYGPTVSLSYILLDFARGATDRSSRIPSACSESQPEPRAAGCFVSGRAGVLPPAGSRSAGTGKRHQLQNSRTVLDAAQRRRESGLATAADVYRAETQVAQAEVNLTRSRGRARKSARAACRRRRVCP